MSLRVVLLILLLLRSTALGAAEVIRLASLEWPPYTGEQLPDGGSTSAVLKAAFAAAGYQLEIDYLPWERTLALANSADSGYAGYFPEYFSSEISEHFLYSVPIGSGPLGLAQRRVKPLVWQQLTDLQPFTIGVVQGYVNTEEFDASVAAGLQRVQPAGSDAQNLKKLAAGRIDAAVIDYNVMRYLLRHDQSLTPVKQLLEFNPRLLEDKLLFVCFRLGPDAERLAKALAQGLEQIDAAAIEASHQ
ncbi:transporter substrate-binding domain-containing protein [Permianibacter sp. IMCC34836]|uniref:substrate-binding periplasmic protein n=1 Tax=Permianibacter fluminis TaxID=2738515 RepID=UPI001553BC1B|nr:transporter substrate-binding domain-containing protein [Permianibacter fluminis]NQD36444.1 transporter substrate-binding domain-containing protein [Permianibacter fluminis]